MKRRSDADQRGFAIVLTILALLLLTTMGMTLAASASTELQGSVNLRWSETAKYNAEAGIEFGRSLLMAIPHWATVLPPARMVSASEPLDWARQQWDPASESDTTGDTEPANPGSTRNFENWKCDEKGYGMGYGVILSDGTPGGTQQFRSSVDGSALNGTFTLWIRRPIAYTEAGAPIGQVGTGNYLRDYHDEDVLILVSEGSAPYTSDSYATTQTAGARAIVARNRAVYTIETVISRSGSAQSTQAECNSRQGQAGGSASGANASGCLALTQPQQVTESLAGGTDLGTGVLK